RDLYVTGVQTCALPIFSPAWGPGRGAQPGVRPGLAVGAAHRFYAGLGAGPGGVCAGRALVPQRADLAGQPLLAEPRAGRRPGARSEERRVGKACRWWGA